MMSKFVHVILLLVTLSSCGNPHLMRRGSSGTSSITPGQNPEPVPSLTATSTPTATPTATPTPTPAPVYNLSLQIIQNDLPISLIDFGSVPKNNHPKKTFSIKNTGNVKAFYLSGSALNGPHFDLNDYHKCLGEIDPQEACTVEVTFKSPKLGLSKEDFSFAYYAKELGNSQNVTLNLTIKGIKTKVSPSGWMQMSSTGNDATGVNFQKSRVEDDIESFIIIRNDSDADAYYVPADAHDKNFEIMDPQNCLSKIPAKGQCVIKIKFKSNAAGKYSSILELRFLDESENNESVVKIPVSGVKVEQKTKPVISFSPFDADGIDFGDVSIGSSYSKVLEVQNKNAEDLVISLDEIKILGENNDITFTGGKFPGTRGTCKDLLRPGRCLMDLTYRPSNVGKIINKLVIKSQGQILLNTTISANGVENANGSCIEKSDYLYFSDGKIDLNDPSIVYPYVTSSTSKASLSKLYGLETNTKFNCPDCEAVKDAMVLTRFNNLNLPLRKMVDAKIQLHVGKISPTTKWLYTEMLCIQNSDVKLCSGELFDSKGEPSWFALINKEFFGSLAKTQNVKFNKYLHEDQKVSSVLLKDGSKIYKSTIMSHLAITDLFDVSLEKVDSILRKGYLNLILVDDTKNVSYPRIMTTFKKDISCGDKN